MKKKLPLFREITSSSYLREQAFEDGTIFYAGNVNECEINLTSNLIASLKKEQLARAVVGGIECARPGEAEKFRMMGNKKWLLAHRDDNDVITVMMAQDY